MKLIEALFFVSVLVACSYSQCPDQDASLVNWSSLYNGLTDVVIDSSQKVRLNTNVQLTSLTIQGTLVFDDTKNVNLTARWIKINPGGVMKIGSQSCPYTHKTFITFTGPYSASNEMGSDPNGGGLGTKGLAVTSGATLEVFGQVPTPTWTRLATTANAGSTTLNLETAVSWTAGNRITIASTDFSAAGNGLVPDQSEENEIVSVTNNGKTLTLKNPLTFMHWADTDGYERAEIGLLTRNIVFQGDESSDQGGFGGHLIFRVVTSVHVSGAEFYRMGQAGILGRYPVHFHLMKDMTQKGFFAAYNAIHRSYQRCVVIHDGMGISVTRNVAYNITGHCYFLEDGPERLNTFDGNLGVRMNPGSLIPSDVDPSVYWITNPNNTVINNVACGGSFGFWYSLPLHPIGLSQADYQSDPWVWPRYTPVLLFDNNVAHSHLKTGLMVDEMEEPDGTTPEIAYTTRQGPFDYNNPQPYVYPNVIVTFSNFIGYKNRDHGVWTRGGPIALRNTVLLDNTDGVLLVPGATIVENALIVGETENVGTVFNYNGLASMGRSRPVYWTNNYPITGWSTYDNTAPQFGRNITFKNFQTNSFRGAGAISSRPNGFFMIPPGDKLEGTKFINANEVYLETWPNAYSAAQPNDINNGWMITDLDGSITGEYGAWILTDTPFTNNNNMNGQCVKKVAWNAVVCPKTFEGFTQLNLNTPYFPTSSSFYKVSFHLLGNPSYPFLNATGGPAGNYIYSVNVVPYRAYTVRWGEQTPPVMTVSMGYSCKREWVILAIPYPAGTTFQITTEVSVTPVTPVNSLAQLTNKYNYFYDSSSQHLYLWIQQLDEAQQEIWDFSYQTSLNAYYSITATCPGNNCAVGSPAIGKNISPPLPPAPVIKMTNFQATMGGCYLSPALDSSFTGMAYGAYDPVTKYFTYNIYHTVKNATRVYIGAGDKGTSGSEWYQLVGTKSPVKGSLIMPVQRINDLWAGKLFVTIESSYHPSGEIRGYFGCVSSDCSAVTLSVVDPASYCNLPGPTMNVFTDGINTGWSNASWGNATIVSQQYTTDKACGTASLRVYLPGNNVNGGFQLIYDFGTTIDTNTYKYISFLIKADQKLTEDFDLYISMSTNYGNYLPAYKITMADIAGFAIDNSGWTQIRVALSTIGFGSGSQPLSVFGLYTLTWVAKPVQLLLDEIKFLPQYSPTTKNVVSGAAVGYNKNEVCIGTAVGTAVSPSTSPSPSVTPTKSPIPSSSPSSSPSVSPSSSPSLSPSPSVTPTKSPVPSSSPSSSSSPSVSSASSPSVTPSRSSIPSSSASPSQTPSNSPSPSSSNSPGASSTPTSSLTPTPSPTKTPSPSSAPASSSSSTPSASPSKAASSTPSPSPVPCPPPNSINCGSFCAGTVQDCLEGTSVCSDPWPFQCYNGECQSDPKDCALLTPTCSEYLCWDGSCVGSAGSCPPVTACPAGSFRCNGLCQSSACSVVGPSCQYSFCADGSCPTSADSCPDYNGCPLNTVMCPDGKCSSNITACMCSSDTFSCFDGSCVADSEDCTPPPSTLKPYPFSIYIPSGETTNIQLVSTDGSMLGTVQMNPQAGATVLVTSVADSVIAEILGSNVLYTPVISLSVQGIPSANFENPVKICLTYTFPNQKQSEMPPNACLGYINGDKFECVSELSIENSLLCGATTHFSEFGAGNFKTTENSGKSNSGTPAYVWVPILIGCVALVAIIVAAVIIVVKKRKSGNGEIFQSVEMSKQNPFYAS